MKRGGAPLLGVGPYWRIYGNLIKSAPDPSFFFAIGLDKKLNVGIV